KQSHLTDRPRASRAISFSLEWPEDLPGRIPFEDGKARRNGCTAFFVRRGRSDQKGLYADELHSLGCARHPGAGARWCGWASPCCRAARVIPATQIVTATTA